MLNKFIVTGRMVRDAELKKTPSGKEYVNFTVCSTRTKCKNEEKPVSDFINCVAWNHTAKFISNWIKKGTLFTASGRIQTRNYKGADGKTVYITEMLCENIEQQFAASKKEDTYVDYDGQVPNYNENDFVIEGFDAGPTLDIESDDLPF